MERKVIAVTLIALLIGLGGGVVFGYLIYKSQIAESESIPEFQVIDVEYIALQSAEANDMLEIFLQYIGNGFAHNIAVEVNVTFPMTSKIENMYIQSHSPFKTLEINETSYVEMYRIIFPFNGTIWSYNITWVSTNGGAHGIRTDERTFLPYGNLTEIIKTGKTEWGSLKQMEIGLIRVDLLSLINEWWIPYLNITSRGVHSGGECLLLRSLEGEVDVWDSEWRKMEVSYEITVTCNETSPQKFVGVFSIYNWKIL